PTADSFRGARKRQRPARPVHLRTRPHRKRTPCGRLYRQGPEGRQARRSAGPAADEIPAHHQSEDRQGARPDDPARDPRSRGRGHRLNRRELLLILAANAALSPLAVRAQQKAMPVIGFLGIGSPGPVRAPYLAAFRQGLSETGYVEGQNAIEYHWAEGSPDRR